MGRASATHSAVQPPLLTRHQNTTSQNTARVSLYPPAIAREPSSNTSFEPVETGARLCEPQQQTALETSLGEETETPRHCLCFDAGQEASALPQHLSRGEQPHGREPRIKRSCRTVGRLARSAPSIPFVIEEAALSQLPGTESRHRNKLRLSASCTFLDRAGGEAPSGMSQGLSPLKAARRSRGIRPLDS